MFQTVPLAPVTAALTNDAALALAATQSAATPANMYLFIENILHTIAKLSGSKHWRDTLKVTRTKIKVRLRTGYHHCPGSRSFGIYLPKAGASSKQNPKADEILPGGCFRTF